MINYLVLAIAILLSAVAAYYSIIGLTTIFVSAFIPIVIMGSSLEAAKVVAASWIYRNWHTAPKLIKYYLVAAIAVLMLITSMGTFGYLSKAHMDQAVPTGGIQDKIAIIDEKIKVAKDNIDANRKALKQMDDAVDQVMGRSADEKGADKAVAIRRGQAKERARLLSEIATEQKVVTQLSEERAPIAAEVRKVEAEVGPIKYIAELIYGEATDDILDKAVRWVILLIVAVFDPLAIVLLIAANHSLNSETPPVVQPPKKKVVVEEEPEVKPEPKTSTPRWLKKASQWKEKKKRGIIEIDDDSIMRMK